MGCSEGLARILVFIANFAFLLVGLALLVVGILYKVNFTKYTDAIPSNYQVVQYIPTIAIVVGAIIFVIAFLGCCGALRNNSCMLSWYGAILIVIFLLQVALAIVAFIQIKNKSEMENSIVQQLNTLFSKYNTGNQVQEVVDLIQQTFSCCGTTGASFWGNSIPNSCYPNNNNQNSYFTQGCNNVFSEFVTSSIRTIAIVALSISAVEVVGAILALCLASSIRETRRQGAYY